MLMSYLKCQTSCLLLKLLFLLQIRKKDGLKHYAKSSLYYTLGKLQSTTLAESVPLEPDSRLSEVELLDQDLWMNFLDLLLTSSEEPLVGNSHLSNVMIFSAKSGKLLLWVASDDQQ